MGSPGEGGDDASKNLTSRKMGQAYLEHSIAELESQLREARLKPSHSSSSNNNTACLLDTSMLVYALPVVKKWTRSDEYAELLLPIDALAMLDILKKADQPVCSQAREAVRWLERQLSMQDDDQSGTYNNLAHYRRRSKLRILNDQDMLTWSQVLKKSTITIARLDDPDPAETAAEAKTSLQDLSLATQTSLRALLAAEPFRQSTTILATASSTSPLDSQPSIVKRVLLDQIPLETTIAESFPTLPLTSVIRVSPAEITHALEAETSFRQAQQARMQQKANLPTARGPHKAKSDGCQDSNTGSGYRQSRDSTPQVVLSGERSPARQIHHGPSPLAGKPTSDIVLETSTSTFWNEPPPSRAVRQTQPKLLQRTVPPAAQEKPSTLAKSAAKHNNTSRVEGRRSQISSMVPKKHTSISSSPVKPASTPKIMLANPRSTARSLSTAT